MKFYEVLFIDEYENFYEIGWFKNLEDAEPYVNEYLRLYKLTEDDDVDPGAVPEFGKNKNLDRLVEYPGTFGLIFDRTILVDEGVVQVRGFIRDTTTVIQEINKIEGENE